MSERRWTIEQPGGVPKLRVTGPELEPGEESLTVAPVEEVEYWKDKAKAQNWRAEGAEKRSQAAHEMRIEAEQEAARYREALERIAELPDAEDTAGALPIAREALGDSDAITLTLTRTQAVGYGENLRQEFPVLAKLIRAALGDSDA